MNDTETLVIVVVDEFFNPTLKYISKLVRLFLNILSGPPFAGRGDDPAGVVFMPAPFAFLTVPLRLGSNNLAASFHPDRSG